MKRKITITMAAAAITLMLSSCGVVEWIAPDNSKAETTTTMVSTRRPVDTTKTAAPVNRVDNDDEGLEGYTTTTTAAAGTLEHDYSDPGIDQDMRSTQRTEAKTYYSIPEHNGTTAAAMTVKGETTTTTTSSTTTMRKTTTSTSATTTSATTTKQTTTEADFDSLYKLEGSKKYSGDKSYTVTSDTTYLNLRFGPSKQYEVQLKIPDGVKITGYGETTGTDGNVWVYVNYGGTYGWVMKELLS